MRRYRGTYAYMKRNMDEPRRIYEGGAPTQGRAYMNRWMKAHFDALPAPDALEAFIERSVSGR